MNFIGNISDLTNGGFDFISPSSMNPVVLLFYGTIIFLDLLLIWWVYFNDGAKFIERHPGLFLNSDPEKDAKVTADSIKRNIPVPISMRIFTMAVLWFLF